MAKQFSVSIVSPDRTVFETPAVSLVAPGVEGYFGVMADHEPFVSELKVGIVTIQVSADIQRLVSLSHGFIEVSGNRVIILADSAENAEEIDARRAERAVERARERLTQLEAGIDVARAREALERAQNRLETARKAYSSGAR
jgi:F-type H+-transporting ATPase subunit epsilon